MEVQYSNGKWPFENRTFWTINRLFQSGFQTTSQIPDHMTTRPFDNRTLIYHSNTRLVRYSVGYCKCLAVSEKIHWRVVYLDLQTKLRLILTGFKTFNIESSTLMFELILNFNIDYLAQCWKDCLCWTDRIFSILKLNLSSNINVEIQYWVRV